jgi:triosephosphate isomerase
MKLAIASLLFGSSAAFSPALSGNKFTSSSTTQLCARKPFISGNWKLNPNTKDEALTLADGIAKSINEESPDADIALFVPYVFIESVMDKVGDWINIGAEGVCPEMAGAYTGSISAPMLKSVGVQWALAGHSERRVIYGETDDYINAQCLKLIEQGMSVMLCIGESLEEFEQDLAGSVCAVQLKKGLKGIAKEDLDRVAIAYEPVWAIGTGKVATPEIAQDVHATCRAIIADIYDQEAADKIRILYGGSVTPESVDDLMSQPDIDGALVGGASLDAEKFGRIINFKTKVAA